MEQKMSHAVPAENSASEQLLPLYQVITAHPNAVYPTFQGHSGHQRYGMPYGQPVPHGQVSLIVQPTAYKSLTQTFPDYLWYSVFIMSCCCLPLGIAALVHSISARDANMRGQREVAERSSRCARILNHTGLVIGIIFFILCFAIGYYGYINYSKILNEMMKEINH